MEIIPLECYSIVVRSVPVRNGQLKHVSYVPVGEADPKQRSSVLPKQRVAHLAVDDQLYGLCVKTARV